NEFLLEDVDADGDTDIVVGQDGLVWFEQQDDGYFLDHPRMLSDTHDLPLDVGDFDGDGDLDILATSYDSLHSETTYTPDRLVWLVNDDGDFTIEDPVPVTAIYLETFAATADVDGDSRLDIIGVRPRFELLLFRRAEVGYRVETPIVSNVSSFDDLAIADMSGDGRADIVSVLEADGAVQWYEQLEGGEFIGSQYVSTNLPQTGSLSTILTTDFDQDGDLDVLATSMGGNRFYFDIQTGASGLVDEGGELLLFRNEAGRFHREELDSFLAYPFGRTSVALGDMDGDGDEDWVIFERAVTGLQYQVAWYENRPGWEAVRRETSWQFEETGQPLPADVDGDGDLDMTLVSSYPRAPRFSWYENLPSVGIATNQSELVEEAGNVAELRFQRGGGGPGPLDVEFDVSGDLQWLADYELAGAASFDGSHGVVSFGEGQSEAIVTLTPVDDDDVEPIERLEIELTAPGGFAIAPQSRVEIFVASLDFLGDYADAPLPYPALFADDGPRHLAQGPRLGATRTFELNALSTASADGDGGDDGVTWPALQVGATAVLEILVGDAPTGARLDAWIDFDADGSWAGSRERIATSWPVVDGVNLLPVPIPSDALAGETYARFRLSTSGGLLVTGESDDGEVEDYRIAI
ncbi:MAG: VCBS repeat-containing protein, partial [Planctomycetales bacterium]|nr:VCBS repeat-containing protein [Planctomycetales bacterium]